MNPLILCLVVPNLLEATACSLSVKKQCICHIRTHFVAGYVYDNVQKERLLRTVDFEKLSQNLFAK